MGQGSGPGLHLPGEVRVLEEQQTKENADTLPSTRQDVDEYQVAQGDQRRTRIVDRKKQSAMPNDVVRDSACRPQEQPESSYLQFAPGRASHSQV